MLLLAAFTKGMLGTGFPLIAVPAAAIILNPRDAVALVTLPNMLANLLILRRGGFHREELARIRWALILGVPATVAGTVLLKVLNLSWLSVLLGSITLVFVVLNLLEITPTKLETKGHLGPAILGVLAGLLQGATGASGPVVTLYMYSQRLPKHMFVYLITVLYTAFNAVQIVSLASLGLYHASLFGLALVAVVPTLVGIHVGFRVQDAVDQRTFNRILMIVLGIIAVKLIIDGLSGS